MSDKLILEEKYDAAREMREREMWMRNDQYRPYGTYVGEKTIISMPEMSRDEMFKVIQEECEKICATFQYKNSSYGVSNDSFHNFREAAKKVLGDDSPENTLKALLIFKDKHDTALTNRGFDDQEFIERCRDIAVYSLIAIGMKKILDYNDVMVDVNEVKHDTR